MRKCRASTFSLFVFSYSYEVTYRVGNLTIKTFEKSNARWFARGRREGGGGGMEWSLFYFKSPYSKCTYTFHRFRYFIKYFLKIRLSDIKYLSDNNITQSSIRALFSRVFHLFNTRIQRYLTRLWQSEGNNWNQPIRSPFFRFNIF